MWSTQPARISSDSFGWAFGAMFLAWVAYCVHYIRDVLVHTISKARAISSTSMLGASPLSSNDLSSPSPSSATSSPATFPSPPFSKSSRSESHRSIISDCISSMVNDAVKRGDALERLRKSPSPSPSPPLSSSWHYPFSKETPVRTVGTSDDINKAHIRGHDTELCHIASIGTGVDHCMDVEVADADEEHLLRSLGWSPRAFQAIEPISEHERMEWMHTMSDLDLDRIREQRRCHRALSRLTMRRQTLPG